LIPLVSVRLDGAGPAIWCKLEYLNPSGSTKDRIAEFILRRAMVEQRLTGGQMVVEASSGSTSIAMARTSAELGLRFTAVVPAGVSNERVLMIRAYGGEVCFTPASAGIAGAIQKSEELALESDAFLPRQFSNMENADAHRLGTAHEIMRQMRGAKVDAVVSGVGTGGTLVGLHAGFTRAGHDALPFVARPIMYTREVEVECCGFSSRIPGVVDSISTIYQPEALPGLRVLEIHDSTAIAVTRRLIQMGFPVGPSAGLNYVAALQAAEMLGDGARIVTVFPDRMERYFSTELFSPYKER
jgi:cysteine synthase A